MAKTILLMRHAEAREGTAEHRDFERCLTDSGRRIAAETGECLKSHGLQIDRVVSSSAARTRQTSEEVAAVVCPSSPLLLLDQLYNAPAEAFVASIRQEMSDEESCVLVVGHNPGIAGLMCQWAEQGLAVPPATVCIFRLEASMWSEVRLHSPAAPQLVCVIQDGRVIRKDSSFGLPVSPET